jgi:sulfite oxidase
MTISLSRRQLIVSSAVLASASRFGLRAWGAEEAARKLKVRSEKPLNAEPELADLVRERLTPTELFYVRNHGPIPEVKAADHRLSISGLVEQTREYTLAELRDKFKPQSAEATLTCAGNRREEMSAIKPVGGVQWSAGAIGHAQWRGCALAEVLKAAGIRSGANTCGSRGSIRFARRTAAKHRLAARFH